MKFKAGDDVVKITGDYHWRGEVRAAFTTPNGHERYVVAHRVDFGYVLHIYSEQNLQLLVTEII